MPFERATLTQLRDDVLQDMATATIRDSVTGQVVAVTPLPNSPLRCIGYSTAGAVYSAYGYLDWLALQAVPWTATDEYALGWGSLKGVTRKAATSAGGGESISGASNADIPAGSLLSRPDGVQYATVAEVSLGASGAATISFEAVAPGAAGNAAPGTTLTFVQPVTGVGAQIVTANAITGGADIETMDAFKGRYLQVYQQPPAGGTQSDFVEWALAVPGVTRAWCNPNGAGAGTVVVYTMWDEADAQWNGFPQGSDGVASDELRDAVAQGDQLTVANAIYPLRLVTALVYSCAPVPQPVDFVLTNLGANLTTSQQAGIEAALDALFLGIGSPLGVTLYPNTWEAALATVSGLPRYTLVSPTGPVTCALGHLAVRGAVSGTA